MAAVLGFACSSSGQSPQAAKAEITSVWTSFFGNHNAPIAQAITEVEDGPSLRAALTVAQKQTPATLNARVISVDLLTSSQCKTDKLLTPCAKVTYDLRAGTSVLLAGSTGFAVRQSGHWKVSKKTICGLLGLQTSGPVPGCT
jgi:hypothetical protein